MFSRRKIFCVLMLAVLLISACQPLLPPETEPAIPAPPNRPDAPTYGVRGPYPVGVQNLAIEAMADDERPLNVTIWYPAVNPDGAPESYVYEMGFKPGEFPLVPVHGRAIENAEPATADGPFPLVVHTHAHWSIRQEAPYLDEHLASNGFVVISTDHEDNWSTLFGPKSWRVEFQRPDEVIRQIDFAEELANTDSTFAGLIDTERVGVTGWSGGGETSLVVGGGRLDLAAFRAWCDDNMVDGEFPDTDCVDVLDYEEDLAALASLDEVPQGLWPDWSDDRIAAVAPLAPFVSILGVEGLQAVDTPTLFVIGGGDSDVGPRYWELDSLAQVSADRKAEVVLEHAEHLVFFSACADAPGFEDIGFHAFCSDPVWDMVRAHDLINHFVTAFMLAELKDDADAAAALNPERVEFLGIGYQAEGY